MPRLDTFVQTLAANLRNGHLAAIVESSEDAIIGRALKGTVTSWNRGAERLLGYSAEEIVGQPAAALVLPGRADELPEVMERVSRGEHVPPFEAQWRRKDERPVEVSVSVSPITGAGGGIVGAATIARDISERKRLEQQVRQAQKMEAVGQLAGGVAHDFNNLLTIISGYSEMLLGSAGPDDPSRDLLQEIHKAGERAGSLTRQLLAFSRKQVLEPRVLDLNAVVGNTEKMLRRLIGEDITLTALLAPALGRVKADAGQIEQVLMNLAVNARDAMPQGGTLTLETGNVELGPDGAEKRPEVRPGPYVMLAVTDTGCGMDEPTKAHIFEPFFTTKEKGKGTGLGLATVYGIIKQSDGYIYVDSEVGRGTTFKIYLPAVAEELPSGKPVHGVKRAASGTETILVAEDEAAVRALARFALQSHGYTVLEAGRGDEAVRVCERHDGPVHLLVTDVVMPGMGGRTLAERLAALRPGIKVLYLSGYTDDAVVRHGILQAETAFVQKPFSPGILAQKVREVLDQGPV